MGYTPTEWHTGDIITEEKLNNMEAGIADGGLPKNTQITKTIFDGTYEFFGEEGVYWSDEDILGTALVIGETYIVTFDGTEYSCVCDYSPSQDINYIGSTDVVDGKVGNYPFFIGYYTDVYGIAVTTSESYHSVKLEGPASSIKPGTAMIFNGTEWTLQSGYGYVTAGKVQVFDAKLLSSAVFDTDDDTPLSEIVEAYNKYGAVYLRTNQSEIGTGIPFYSREGISRFEFPTKRYTLNGESGNSTITLEFRFYADGNGFTYRSDPQGYTIPLTWIGH